MTTYIQPWNYAAGVLTQPVNNSQTTITVQVTTPGFSFPVLSKTTAHAQQYYYLTVVDAATQGTITREIMKVTGPSSGGTGAITLTVVRAQEGTSAQTFVTGDGAAIRYTRQTILDASYQGSPDGWYNVKDFGAVADGVTDNTSAVQDAINAAGQTYGGAVVFPPGLYSFAGQLVVPDNVCFRGTGVTGLTARWDAGAGPSPKQSVILCRYIADDFIKITGSGTGMFNLMFYYPDQVANTAATPTAYPPTIHNVVGDFVMQNCTIINAYDALKMDCGRVYISDCLIGAYHRDITFDFAAAETKMDRVTFSALWDVVINSNYPSNIDHWVIANRVHIASFQNVTFQWDNIQCFSSHAAITFADSANGNSLGQISNLVIENAENGILASSTAGGAPDQGISITNLSISVGGTFPGTPAQAIWLQSGGASPPYVEVSRGSVTGGYTHNSLVDAGVLQVRDVFGLDLPGGQSLSTPSVPASGTPVANQYPFDVTVYLVGGTVTGVAVASHALGAQTSVRLPANTTITLTYSSAPTWVWIS